MGVHSLASAGELRVPNRHLDTTHQSIGLVGVRFYSSKAPPISCLVVVFNDNYVAKFACYGVVSSTWTSLVGYGGIPSFNGPRIRMINAGLFSNVSLSTDLLFEKRQAVVEPVLFSL